MKNLLEILNTIVAVIGGMIGFLLGGVDRFLYALIVFVIIDYATGVIKAVVKKKLSSEVGFHGIAKKVVIFCLVAIGQILDTHVLKVGSVLREAIIFFYLSNEGISIIENCGAIGLPIPKKLQEVILQLKGEEHDD